LRKVDIKDLKCCEGIKEKLYKWGIPTSRGVREEVINIQVGRGREREMRGRFKTFNIKNSGFFPDLQIQTRGDHLTSTLLNKRHTFKKTFP
jgi:hypothetical protein